VVRFVRHLIEGKPARFGVTGNVTRVLKNRWPR